MELAFYLIFMVMELIQMDFNDMRTWIGYLLSGEELDSSDAFLNENFPINDTSIFSLIDIF